MPHVRLSARVGLDGHVMWHAVTQTRWRIPVGAGPPFSFAASNCWAYFFSVGYIGFLQCVQMPD